MLFTMESENGLFTMQLTETTFDILVTEDGEIVYHREFNNPDFVREIPEYIKDFETMVEFRKARELGAEDVYSRVVYHNHQLMQLQIVADWWSGGHIALYFDTDLNYRFETHIESGELQSYINTLIKPKTIPGTVLRNALGDCTNKGISSTADTLYIISDKGYYSSTRDIRECVYLEEHRDYMSVRPVYKAGQWYMAGGNFIYSSDSRWRDGLGITYPLSVHDRCEE